MPSSGCKVSLLLHLLCTADMSGAGENTHDFPFGKYPLLSLPNGNSNNQKIWRSMVCGILGLQHSLFSMLRKIQWVFCEPKQIIVWFLMWVHIWEIIMSPTGSQRSSDQRAKRNSWQEPSVPLPSRVAGGSLGARAERSRDGLDWMLRQFGFLSERLSNLNLLTVRQLSAHLWKEYHDSQRNRCR